MKPTLTAILLGAAMLVAAPALADPEPLPAVGTKDIEKEKKIKVRVVRKADGSKVFVVDTPLVLHGRIEKPSAFYLLERTRLDTGVTPLKRAFTDKILESVRKSPF